MTKIQINGEELTIVFNLATELAYEELTGRAFDAQEILPQDETPHTQDIIKVALACVITNNPDTTIDSDYILHTATRQECTELVHVTMQEMLKWLTVPAIAEQHIPEPDADQAEEEEPKNA